MMSEDFAMKEVKTGSGDTTPSCGASPQEEE
jgi:hypothetical protein